MINKRAAGEGASIAVIMFVIALFMVLYILFIPPEERARLLNTKSEEVNDQSTRELTELLAISPGTLSPQREFGESHPIPSINLFVKTEPVLEQLAQNLVIKKGIFSRSSPKLKFQTEDTQNTKRVTLNFYVDKASGELKIKLNGRTVYSEEVGSGAQIIDLNKNLLKGENELEFFASGPGIAFWQTNTFNLKNIILKQEFERINTREERRFTLTNSEIQSMSRATLKYTQVCNQRLEGGTTLLDISINDQRVESLRISCVTTDQELEIGPKYFIGGQNTITFTLEEGDFSFNQIVLKTQSKEIRDKAHQFSIPAKEFEKIKSGEKSVRLELLFAQERKQKNARLGINNNELLINTADNSFSRDITDLVVDGTNFLRIVPSNSFTVNSLKVILE